MSYQMHKTLVDPARPKSELWRLGIGLILAATLYSLLVFSYFEIIRAFSSGSDLVFDVVDGNSPLGVVLLLLSFTTMCEN